MRNIWNIKDNIKNEMDEQIYHETVICKITWYINVLCTLFNVGCCDVNVHSKSFRVEFCDSNIHSNFFDVEFCDSNVHSKLLYSIFIINVRIFRNQKPDIESLRIWLTFISYLHKHLNFPTKSLHLHRALHQSLQAKRLDFSLKLSHVYVRRCNAKNGYFGEYLFS